MTIRVAEPFVQQSASAADAPRNNRRGFIEGLIASLGGRSAAQVLRIERA